MKSISTALLALAFSVTSIVLSLQGGNAETAKKTGAGAPAAKTATAAKPSMKELHGQKGAKTRGAKDENIKVDESAGQPRESKVKLPPAKGGPTPCGRCSSRCSPVPSRGIPSTGPPFCSPAPGPRSRVHSRERAAAHPIRWG